LDAEYTWKEFIISMIERSKEGGAKPLFRDHNMKSQDSSSLDYRNEKCENAFCIGYGHRQWSCEREELEKISPFLEIAT
jgi:hypothetical protein